LLVITCDGFVYQNNSNKLPDISLRSHNAQALLAHVDRKSRGVSGSVKTFYFDLLWLLWYDG